MRMTLGEAFKAGQEVGYIKGRIDEDRSRPKDTTKESLFSAMSYNGEDEILMQLYNDMKMHFKQKNPSYFYRPELINTATLELFWMVIVESFGNCGTSPRGGWIEPDRAQEAVEWLRQGLLSTIPEWDYRAINLMEDDESCTTS